MYHNVYILIIVFVCVVQCMGDCWPAGWRFVGAEDLQVDAGAEAGALHAGAAETACGSDEDYG